MMLYKLLSRVDRERFEPVVISLMDQGMLGARIEALNVSTYAIGMKHGLPTLATVLRLVRLVRRLEPNVIQGWMPHGNLAATLAGAFATKPAPVLWNVRQSIYSLKYEKPATAAIISLCAWLSGSPAKILYNSWTGAAQHEALGYRSEKRLVIPNGFDTELFAPSAEARGSIRAELGVAKDTVLVGLVGNYHHLKDHANFLHAAALLLKEHPTTRFVLCGKGIELGNRFLREIVDNLEIDEHVHLLGARRDISHLTAALDVASSSSYSEGFSNAIGEAMSCGVPCVVTDVGDLAWIVGEMGRVVPPRNPQALASGWELCLQKDRHESGPRVRSRIRENFSVKRMVEQTEKAVLDAR